MTEKAVTSSLFSERAKNTLGNFFPFTMGTRSGDELDTPKETEDSKEIDEFESQVGLEEFDAQKRGIHNHGNWLFGSF